MPKEESLSLINKKLEEGDYDKAIQLLNSEIVLDSENGQLFNLRGHAYYEVKSYENAIQDFDIAGKSIELDTLSLFRRGLNNPTFSINLPSLGLRESATTTL